MEGVRDGIWVWFEVYTRKNPFEARVDGDHKFIKFTSISTLFSNV